MVIYKQFCEHVHPAPTIMADSILLFVAVCCSVLQCVADILLFYPIMCMKRIYVYIYIHIYIFMYAYTHIFANLMNCAYSLLEKSPTKTGLFYKKNLFL